MNDRGIKKYIPRPTAATIAVTGAMIALEIILERIIPIINAPTLKVNLAFVPMAAVAVLYGPLYCGAAWAITDLIGALLFPTGTYFPGFTLSQFLSGLIFGFMLFRIYESEKVSKTAVRTLLSTVPHMFGVSLFLGTYWLSILYGSSYFALLPARLIGSAINFAVETVVVFLMCMFARKNKRLISPFINKNKS